MNDTFIHNTTGTIASLHSKGFGFLIFTTSAGRQVRIYFHLADSDGTQFGLGDRVCFDLGLDTSGRTRAYNVKFISAAAPKIEGAL